MNWLLLTSEFDFKKGLRAWARVSTIFSPDFNPDNSNSGSCNSTRVPSNYLFLFYKGKNTNHVTWSCYVCKALYTLKLLKNHWLSIFNTVNWILQLTPLTRTLAWSNCFSFPFMVRVTGVLLYLKNESLRKHVQAMGMSGALSALCTRKLPDPYKRKRNCWSMKKKVFIWLYWSLPYYIQNENSSFKIYNVLNCLLIQEILIEI